MIARRRSGVYSALCGELLPLATVVTVQAEQSITNNEAMNFGHSLRGRRRRRNRFVATNIG